MKPLLGSIIGSVVAEIRRKKYKISEVRDKYLKKSEFEKHFWYKLMRHHNSVTGKKKKKNIYLFIPYEI